MANWGAGVGAGFLLEMSLQLQAFSTHSCSESQTRGKGSSSRKSRYLVECTRTEKTWPVRKKSFSIQKGGPALSAGGDKGSDR